jgi:hypothetical protein
MGTIISPQTAAESMHLHKGETWTCTQALSTHLDVLQEDSPSSLVLNFHQLLSVLTFFVGLVLEKLSKVVQGLVITIEVIRLRQKVKVNSKIPGWFQFYHLDISSDQ